MATANFGNNRTSSQRGSETRSARRRLFAGRSALTACLAVTAALATVTACGDDDDGGASATGGKGGSSGSSTTGGNGGSSGSKATGGSSGESGGGSSGSSGSSGTAGTDTGGAGGAPGGAGDGGSGDTGPGGEGGGGGEMRTFWPNGVTSSGISATADDRFHGVAIDAANNVYAAGYLGDGVVMTGTSRQVVVAKYNSNAELVTGFGSQGLALADLSPYLGLPNDTTTTADDPDVSQETARDVALQSDGSIVVAGVVENPTVATPDRTTPLNIFVMRFTAAGARDSTFNTGGAVAGLQVLNPNANSTNPLVYGIAIDATNRIYVFAHGNAASTTRTDQDRYVYRLNANGTLDTTFGMGGSFTFDIPNGTLTLALGDNARRGMVLANGTVVASGYTPVAGRNQIVLARLTSGGMPDGTFSGDGIVRLAPFPLGFAECYGVGVQSDGSIVTTGYGNPDVERGTANTLLDMVSFRVLPNGGVDPAWAGSGGLAYDVNAGEDRGRAIIALPDDRILIAGGGTQTAADKDPMLLLLEKDGIPAEDFDTITGSRKLYGSFGSSGDEFFSLQKTPGQAGGVIAAAGYAPTGGTSTITNGNGTLVIVPIPTP